MRIDAHQHFWQLAQPFDYRWLDRLEHRPIRRDFLPADLEPLLKAAGIERSIFVQTQHDVAENRWVLGLAEKHDFIAGVVGWVDLASPACEEQLVDFRRHPKAVGIRHITQDEPDDDFIVRPDVVRGLKLLEKHGVPFDLLFFAKHLRHAPTLARMLPDLPMVIDHLSKPRIRERQFDDWHAEVRAAAACPNLFCKISGIVTEADWRSWTVEDLRPYVNAAIEAFGPERLMFGSDWPVCELAATYSAWHAAAVELTSSLSADERDQIFGGAARRFYRLP